MTPDRVNKMSYKERQWWLIRLDKQFKKEKEAMEKSTKA